MKKNNVKITFNNEQIQIDQKVNGIFGINWVEITFIQVYKRDLFTVDGICMEISTSKGKSFEINEQMTGWDELVKSLSNHLEKCITFEEWYPLVAKPPYETNLTEIYNSNN